MASGQYGGGSGTAEEPYLINTAEQLQGLGGSSGDWDKHFLLMADIDLSEYDGQDGREAFKHIGRGMWDDYEARFYGTGFSGVFDGGGHTVSHFRYV